MPSVSHSCHPACVCVMQSICGSHLVQCTRWLSVSETQMRAGDLAIQYLASAQMQIILRSLMLPVSKMAAAVQQSATLAAGAKARQLKADGKTVFDFSLGEPDFKTPAHICQAAYKAMLDGHTHYTPAAGIPELRKAIGSFYKKT